MFLPNFACGARLCRIGLVGQDYVAMQCDSGAGLCSTRPVEHSFAALGLLIRILLHLVCGDGFCRLDLWSNTLQHWPPWQESSFIHQFEAESTQDMFRLCVTHKFVKIPRNAIIQEVYSNAPILQNTNTAVVQLMGWSGMKECSVNTVHSVEKFIQMHSRV